MSIHQPHIIGCPFRESELKLLEELATGTMVKQAAHVLGRSEWTINRQISDMKRVSGKQTTAGIVAMAIRQGWIQ